MVYRRVLEWPDKKLKAKSRCFIFKDDSLICEDLIDTFNVTGGYGLSAPQIGFNVRVIVINEKLLMGDEDLSSELTMINPEVTSVLEKVPFEEACFSLPGVALEVLRFPKVEVSWLNLDGSKSSREFEGYISACIQHEVDHLDGILTIDKISQLRKSMLIKKYKKTKLLESRVIKSRKDNRKKIKSKRKK